MKKMCLITLRVNWIGILAIQCLEVPAAINQWAIALKYTGEDVQPCFSLDANEVSVTLQ